MTSGVMQPLVANMQARPCLVSPDLRRLKFSMAPFVVKPANSQTPSGASTPSSISEALSGDAVQSPVAPGGARQAVLKNMPVVASIAIWS